MSKKELTSAEKDTTTISKEPTVTTTDNSKAESTEEATVNVNSLDVFITLMLLEDSPAAQSLDFIFEEMGFSNEWTKGRVSIVDRRWNSDEVQKTENHVPTVAVSPKKTYIPDVPSKASGARLRILGVEAPGDRSHKVPERLPPFKEGLSGEPPDSHRMSWWNNLKLSQQEKHPMTRG